MTSVQIPADNILPESVKADADRLVAMRVRVEEAAEEYAAKNSPAVIGQAKAKDDEAIRQCMLEGKPLPKDPHQHENAAKAKAEEARLRLDVLRQELAEVEREVGDILGNASGEIAVLAEKEAQSIGAEYAAAVEKLLSLRGQYMNAVRTLDQAILTADEWAHYHTREHRFGVVHQYVIPHPTDLWRPRVHGDASPHRFGLGLDPEKLGDLRIDAKRHARPGS